MTAPDFVAWVQSYYGPIPKGQREDIVEYVHDLAPRYLDALRDSVKRVFSSQYGKTPDVAIFEECTPEALTDHREAIQAQETVGLLEDQTLRGTGELMRIDWAHIFREGIKQREEAEKKRQAERSKG